MLGVAQQFVTTAYAAASANNWNLVQTLETAADVSLQIAALPVGSRVQTTEPFIHEGTKHDITVDPNAADPFASFSDHSKGQDLAGAIVEGVVGVVINVLAVIPVTAPVFAPVAVAWDTAQAAKAFSNDDILGGFLNLAAAAGVGLTELDAVASAGYLGSTLNGFEIAAEHAAEDLGFVASDTTAAAQLGNTIFEGAAIVGGTAGIVQSAENGDGLGIAAGVLELAAGVAGGLVSLSDVSPDVASVLGTISDYGGKASAALSISDAFERGDLAGGLASSLNVLFSLIAQNVGQSEGATTTSGNGTAPVIPVTQENLPPTDPENAYNPFDGPGVDISDADVAALVGGAPTPAEALAGLGLKAAAQTTANGALSGQGSDQSSSGAIAGVAPAVVRLNIDPDYFSAYAGATVSFEAPDGTVQSGKVMGFDGTTFAFEGGAQANIGSVTAISTPAPLLTVSPDGSFNVTAQAPIPVPQGFVALSSLFIGAIASTEGGEIALAAAGVADLPVVAAAAALGGVVLLGYGAWEVLRAYGYAGASLPTDGGFVSPPLPPENPGLIPPPPVTQPGEGGFTTGPDLSNPGGETPTPPDTSSEAYIPPDFDPATTLERAELKKNMEAAGTLDDGDQAHHIVPGGGAMNGGRDPGPAQQVLADFGIDLNGTDNGVGLSPEFHAIVHTKGYYDYVNELLLSATTKSQAIEALGTIRDRLLQAEQTFQTTGIMPTW